MRLAPWLLLVSALFLAAGPAGAARREPAVHPGVYEATVIRIVDGDTIDVAARLPVGAWTDIVVVVTVRVRLCCADTPEKKQPRCESEKAAALAASDALARLAPIGSVVILSQVQKKRDRYGRLVASVAGAAGDLTLPLIAAGLARPYHGERRAGWC